MALSRRLCSLALAGALVIAPFCFAPTARAVSTSAQAALLMEADTGRVLYAQRELEPRSVASVTKLVTALTAVALCPDVDAPVTVDPAAVGAEGSSMYLAAGEVLPLKDLLYGLLLRSGNDAAAAIAIHCAGSIAAFAEKMNETAAALGMERSHFENPSGLEQEGHYSCAYDLALAARAVLAHPLLAKVVATRSVVLGQRSIVNHNKLLWSYPGCIGLKTGFTKKAGRTLVSAARRDGTTLIAVTLDDAGDWADHTALLDWGFAHYRSQPLARTGKVMGQLPVRGSLLPAVGIVTAEEFRACLAADEAVSARLDLPAVLTAPVAAGEAVGALVFYRDGAELGRVALAAAGAVPAHPAKRR